MAPRIKGRQAAFDPNKSDSDDLDYGAEPAERTRPQSARAKKRKPKGKAPAKRPAKRQRKERYGDSDDDIEPDSEEVAEEESFAEDESDEAPVEVNPKTGRSVRSAAKKPVKYEEKSEDEIEADESEEPKPRKRAQPKKKSKSPAVPETKLGRPSLIVRLEIAPEKLADKVKEMAEARSTRSRAGSKSRGQRAPTPATSSNMGTRRSSRISHDEEAPLVALTESGKHEEVRRAGSATPEPMTGRRPTRGAKSLAQYPSAIMEEPNEDSQSQPQQELLSQLQAAADEQATQGNNSSPEAEDTTGDADVAKVDDEDIQMEVIQESQEDDEDEAPVPRGGRNLRRRKASSPIPSQAPARKRLCRSRKSAGEPSSDFEPDGEPEAEEDLSESDDNRKRTRPGSSNSESQGTRRSGRIHAQARSQRSKSRRLASGDDADEELDADEIADEAADLADDKRRNRPSRRTRQSDNDEIAYEHRLRARNPLTDYRIWKPESQQFEDQEAADPPTASQSRKRGGGGGAYRTLFSTFGPFGGAGRADPVLGAPDVQEAAGGADSDSSDDEGRGGQGIGGAVGMTPTSGIPKPYVAQAHNADPVQGAGGGPPALGRVKDRKLLADADPLGVDTNVTFEGVGGLAGHVDSLKEMVMLPLLYPEVFQQFKVTPPRGVLFHGPPGTGKTLLARALASSVSSNGKKVTFYMRKGADALSKWVGEAEKQLRMLFEEARKNQPSIIFFDEIDGLAPVRSSKQEQIHASIVATLLALMDGMDGRGQVIVIGATNRPDSVDPALRRPGRFDREFYFPLPDEVAREEILDIHTRGWEPPLKPQFKKQLAEMTKGYGGADLRALCTEAALNAVQGTFPQIYASDKKLLIDPTQIKVMAKDFMISANKIIPSSERSAATGAVPLKKDVLPLLRKPLEDLNAILQRAIPRKRKVTALEEAMFDDRDDELGFERENMQRQFESSRIFRPRLLIKGLQGMGQQYLSAALLSKLEGLHVQNMGLSVIMSDTTKSPEAAIIQQFEEVKRHKPSVIYLPDVERWYRTLSDAAIKTFTALLRSIPPTDPVLVLGYMELEKENQSPDSAMMRDLFGYSLKNQYDLNEPDSPERRAYFEQIINMVRKGPNEFPDENNRKRRKLDVLPLAPSPTDDKRAEPSKAEQKAQKKKDRHTLNLLKLQLQPIMDQIKIKYRKFRQPIAEEATIAYLFDEQDPNVLTTDLTEEQRMEQAMHRPFEIDQDEKGVQGLREVMSGKFYYNLDIATIENRLSNGYYKRPKDFLADVKRLVKDAKQLADKDRLLKANEMFANVEVDVTQLEHSHLALTAECEAVYAREQAREREVERKAADAQQRGEAVVLQKPNVPPQTASKTTTETSGPIMLGQKVEGPRQLFPITPGRLPGPSPVSQPWSTTNGHSHTNTNDSKGPSRPNEDSEMLDSPHGMPYPQQYSQMNTQGHRSQRSGHTQLAQNSQLSQYHNSASTTTSGQKTSDRSNRSSGPYTQLSNGNHPDFFGLVPASGGSQFPDTQEVQYHSSQSQPASQSSQQQAQQQAMPPPALQPHRQSGIHNLLNENPNPNTTGTTTAVATDLLPPPQPTFRVILDDKVLANLHDELTKRSSGLSVEQLEQVNAALMQSIWETRTEWNRNVICTAVMDAFNEVIKDIEECQRVLKASQDEEDEVR